MGRIEAGQSFAAVSAAEFNRHVATSDWYHRNKALGEGGGGLRFTVPSDLVEVKNTSGGNRRLGELLEIDDATRPLTDLDPEYAWFLGVTPNAQRVFGILTRPTPSNDQAPLQIAGGCKALVNFSDADHRAAYVEKDSYVLKSAFVGPVQIVWKPSGTGEKECWVLLTPRAPMPAIVQIHEPSMSVSVGDLLASNADGLHPARIRQFGGATGGSVTTLQDAWVRVLDWFDDDGGVTIAEQGRYHTGTIVGMATSGGQARPLVLVELGDVTYLSKPDNDIAKGASGATTLYNRDESASGISRTAKALGFAVVGGKWTTTVRFRGGAWYVGCWEV